jgi:Cd2+/Zn2+-exporting ATPase
VHEITETAGHGVIASVNGRRIAVGNEKLMELQGASSHPCELKGTIIHVSIDGVYAGHIVISDRVKADAAEAVAALHRAGIRRTVMLTGDQPEIAAAVAAATGVDAWHANLLPADKVALVEKLLDEARHGGLDDSRHSRLDRESHEAGALAFVGDGINDAPVLARADLGIAMGALGSDAAIEAADVVLMDDKPSKVAEAVRIARRTLSIARENLVFAIGIKVLVLLLAAFGLATLWMAVFADVGVTVLAVLNAMRALRV